MDVYIQCHHHRVLTSVSLQYAVKSWSVISTTLFFFLKIVLTILGPFHFSMNFRVSLLISAVFPFMNVDVFQLICIFSSIPFNDVLLFSVYKVCFSFVKFTHEYFIFGCIISRIISLMSCSDGLSQCIQLIFIGWSCILLTLSVSSLGGW